MPGDDEYAELPGTSLTRLPRAAVLAAQGARLPVGLLGDYLPALVSAAETGRRLTTAELDRFRELGRAAAEAGASLRALVDLYLSATWRAWPSLPAAGGEELDAAGRTRAAAAAVLRASDDAVAAVCEGYDAARVARARAEEALRRELVDDLLTGTSTDPGVVLERAAAFGLRLEAPHVVLVTAGERRFVDGRGTARAVDAGLRSTCATEPLVAVKEGLLVCVVPQETDDPDAPVGGLPRQVASRPLGFTPLPAGMSHAALGASRALAVLTGALSAKSGPPGWRVGVSRPRTGVTGVRIGFGEAASAVDLAGRLGLLGQPTHTDDLLIYKVLLRDREPLAELVETVLGPLRAARGGAGPLLDTLDAYFATGAVALAAARRLHLSVRALTYRLARIHQLTRHDPTSPTDRYVLQTALLGARLLRWDQPGP
ncbi:PucR family transcriptional regulator [Frankia nepalensis]|uniref:PucR family transcriptional regulator n=1 Tax=Frankia nepalensis TaxID=1836974 RepID=UPI0027DB98DD|nr:helix-turn-helix domain-containing protein [Frankia nepalensis]